MKYSEESIFKSNYLRLSFNSGADVIDFSNHEILGDIAYVPPSAPEMFVSETGLTYSMNKPQQEYFSFNLKYTNPITRAKFEKVRKHIQDGYELTVTIDTFVSPMTAWPLVDNIPTIEDANDKQNQLTAIFSKAVIELPPDFPVDYLTRGVGVLRLEEIPIKVYNSGSLPLPSNSCALLTASDFQARFILDGSGGLTRIDFGLPTLGGSLIDTINNFPNGTLIDPSGLPVRNMVYGLGSYLPVSAITLTPGTWTLQINSISVTTTTGDTCIYNLTKTYFYSSTNQAPTISNIVITGEFNDEGTLVASYNFNDLEGDLQDVPATVEGFYLYDDAGGSVNETLTITGKQYNPSVSHAGKYVRFKVTPHAQTGTSPGIEYQSAVYGPIVQLEEFTFNTNFNPATDGTFDPAVTYTGPGSVYWEFEDGSKINANSISTTTNGLDGSTQAVKIKVESLANITLLDIENDKVTGSINFAQLTGLQAFKGRGNWISSLTGFSSSHNFTGDFLFSNNTGFSMNAADFATPGFTGANFQGENLSGLTGVFAFKNGSSFSNFLSGGCTGITGATMNNISFNGGDTQKIDFNGCTSLAALSLPTSSAGSIGWVDISNTLVPGLDITYIQVSREIRTRSASNLSQITYGAQTNQIYQILADDCPNLNTLQDYGSFDYLPDYILLTDSPVPEITLPNSAPNAMQFGIVAANSAITAINNLSTCTSITESNGFTINLKNNNLSETSVNTISKDLETAASTGFTGRKYEIDGGTNAAPTSGPPDGSDAVSRLAAVYNFTVSTN